MRALIGPEAIAWARARARYSARRWPGLDAEELEGRLLERWVATGRRPYADRLAIDLLRERVRQQRADAAPMTGCEPELPEPPEDRSQLALDAYVLECRALGASCAAIARSLGVRTRTVTARLGRVAQAGALRRGRRWNWRGERVSA